VWGCQRWGDNVEDEWWVVYLLRAATASIPGISAQVSGRYQEIIWRKYILTLTLKLEFQ
jgi:hypothetical protein